MTQQPYGKFRTALHENAPNISSEKVAFKHIYGLKSVRPQRHYLYRGFSQEDQSLHRCHDQIGPVAACGSMIISASLQHAGNGGRKKRMGCERQRCKMTLEPDFHSEIVSRKARLRNCRLLS